LTLDSGAAGTKRRELHDDAQLGLGKWQLGPALVLVWDNGPLLAGVLVYNAFSIGGNDRRPTTSSLFLEPFVNVNFPTHTYLVYAPEITNDWKRSDDWILPLGFGIGQILKLGAQPASFTVQGYGNLISPETRTGLSIRVETQLLYPENKKKK
jgi:hypothetical protein